MYVFINAVSGYMFALYEFCLRTNNTYAQESCVSDQVLSMESAVRIEGKGMHIIQISSLNSCM